MRNDEVRGHINNKAPSGISKLFDATHHNYGYQDRVAWFLNVGASLGAYSRLA